MENWEFNLEAEGYLTKFPQKITNLVDVAKFVYAVSLGRWKTFRFLVENGIDQKEAERIVNSL